ncbi:MAG: acyltransferase [Burkholderiaceae bacterium]|nr:acyltransferase [Roseateles sp.]MBV8471657.1 acyltransferase [Burkholderiaceae bacterium]
MKQTLPSLLLGVTSLVLLVLNTLFWCACLFVLALVKLLLPWRGIRVRLDAALNAIACAWIACNSKWLGWTHPEPWDIGIDAQLNPRGWYLVNSNHQSWVDILVLQRLFLGRIPMLKFFLKQQLIYVPVIGLAWWALDFPFMKRHSSAALKARPELRLQDLETTRRACEKFSQIPTSVMNFAEGTRFRTYKHEAQRSPYGHLLKPKAGALALALNVMGGQFQSLLDVTIVYPEGVPTFWQFTCNIRSRVIVRVRERPIPAQFCSGDYGGDERFRDDFQQWLGQIWTDKDAQIAALLAPRIRG